jgi:hypothetical protein
MPLKLTLRPYFNPVTLIAPKKADIQTSEVDAEPELVNVGT